MSTAAILFTSTSSDTAIASAMSTYVTLEMAWCAILGLEHLRRELRSSYLTVRWRVQRKPWVCIAIVFAAAKPWMDVTDVTVSR